MDLNELLHAHQVEVMRASASGDDGARQSHFGMIAKYADQIRNLRKISPTIETAQDPSAPPTIIYGSYAGRSAAEVPKVSAPCSSDAYLRPASENPDRGKADC